MIESHIRIKGRDIACPHCKSEQVGLRRIEHSEENIEESEFLEWLELHYQCVDCSEKFFQLYGMLPPVD